MGILTYNKSKHLTESHGWVRATLYRETLIWGGGHEHNRLLPLGPI